MNKKQSLNKGSQEILIDTLVELHKKGLKREARGVFLGLRKFMTEPVIYQLCESRGA